jgi:mono/diheme cytochrome c family protein
MVAADLQVPGPRIAQRTIGGRPAPSGVSRPLRILVTLLIVAAALVAAGAAMAWRPQVARAESAAATRFDAALVARGANLAAIGNCRGCHTTGIGPPLGGGVALHSPFGIIYSTNISPDVETGIGRWSEEAFRRAMREGVARDGTHLYPAFPYERFTHVTDDDLKALYAWVMTQPPVRYAPPPNELHFPFNIRAGIALWKLAFFHEGPMAATERGDYLVDSLGHCGSCHSPRNFAYAEDTTHELAGGDAEGWHAYAIQADNHAVTPWNDKDLAFYLRHGFHPAHGVSRGTMGLVTAELAQAEPADVEAMARAIVKRMAPGVAGKQAWAGAVKQNPLAPKGTLQPGEPEAIYKSTCATCHDGRRPLPYGGLPLAESTGLSGESPRNLINVILHGLDPAGNGTTTPVMPAYGGALTDAQVEALVTWLRANLTDQPPWQDVGRLVADSRKMEPSMLRFPPGGSGTDPLETGSP